MILLALLLVPTTISYTAAEVQPESHKWGENKEEDRKLIDGLIVRYSEEYGVSEAIMHKVVRCESNYSVFALGDSGQSKGLVQIHGPSWPQITEEEAYNPEFALDFLAHKLSQGQGGLWTCYRMIK